MKDFFRLEERKTNVKTEFIAGTTTFTAMSYILMVNPGMFSELDGISFNAIYIATALSAFIGTVIIGIMANLPLAMASGMGLNAFFVYSVCMGFGFTYANALIFILIDGIIFVILTVTGLRQLLFNAIPRPVKTAIPAGIGLFIAFIGLQDAGLVVNDSSTCVSLSSFNLLGTAAWSDIMPRLVCIGALFTIGILYRKGVKGSILISIVGASILYYLLGFTVPGFYDSFMSGATLNPFSAFKEFKEIALFTIFSDGFDFSAYLSCEGHTAAGLAITFITTSLAFCLLDMFDTMGTLYGACRGGNLLKKNQETGEMEVPNMEKAMLSDAIATCIGALCGTSTVTSYVESSSGAAAGGRTGLASMFTAGFFFIAMFFSPIVALIPSCAYAAALIYVGILMIGSVKDIDWDNPVSALPAFLTISMMPFTYNISYGIAFGVISFVVIKLFTKESKEVSPASWVIAFLFLIMFFFTH